MEVAQNGWFHFMDNPIYKLILTRGTRISGTPPYRFSIWFEPCYNVLQFSWTSFMKTHRWYGNFMKCVMMFWVFMFLAWVNPCRSFHMGRQKSFLTAPNLFEKIQWFDHNFAITWGDSSCSTGMIHACLKQMGEQWSSINLPWATDFNRLYPMQIYIYILYSFEKMKLTTDVWRQSYPKKQV